MTEEEVCQGLISGDPKELRKILKDLGETAQEVMRCVDLGGEADENYTYETLEYLRMICESVSGVSMATGTWMKHLGL